jgi:hypothetical protein
MAKSVTGGEKCTRNLRERSGVMRVVNEERGIPIVVVVLGYL